MFTPPFKFLSLTLLGVLTLLPPILGGAVPNPATTTGVTVAVAPQYDSIHVYVAPRDMDQFVASFIGTFGGQSSQPTTVTVTPTPSNTVWQFLQTPVGAISVFGYKTPIPFPFGAERTGYLVTDMNTAILAARSTGAAVIVAPFPDAIGQDAVIQWPGGVNTQLYWHKKPPSAPALQTVPENRVYVSPDVVDEFVRDFLAFSKGRLVSDNPHAPGIEIGRPGKVYRRIRITSNFGELNVLVTDGQLPFPYGREIAGFEVKSVSDTVAKAKTFGVTVLVNPYSSPNRKAAMLEFPGGFIAEIHSPPDK
jgi:hypothetical protein